MIRKAVIGGAVVAGALVLGHAAQAGIIFSGTGMFAGPAGDETIFNNANTTFTLTQSENVTVDTLGYAGGTQADGNVRAGRRIQNSDLALFSGTGPGATLIASNDGASGGNPLTVPLSTFGACPASRVAYRSSATGLVGDSCIMLPLAAGTYTVALTEYDNDAIGPTLGAGFVETTFNPGDPDFTGDEFGSGAGNGTCTQFCDAGGNQRTNAFALDITVPEPATLPLFAAASSGNRPDAAALDRLTGRGGASDPGCAGWGNELHNKRDLTEGFSYDTTNRSSTGIHGGVAGIGRLDGRLAGHGTDRSA